MKSSGWSGESGHDGSRGAGALREHSECSQPADQVIDERRAKQSDDITLVVVRAGEA